MLDVAVRGVTGREVTGLVARAPDGEVRGVAVGALVASGSEPIAIDVDATLAVSDVAIERRLDAAALVDSLQAAQARLEQAPAGTSETWTLPPGRFPLTAGLQLGAAGRSVRLVGTRQGGTATELALGTTVTPLAGDLVALDLVGVRVTVDELSIRARATGEVTALRVQATERADLSDVALSSLRGASVVGVSVDGPAVSLVDVTVSDAWSAAGPVVGVVVDGTQVSLGHVRVERLRADGGDATGVRVASIATLSVSSLRVDVVAGTNAVGAAFRALRARCRAAAARRDDDRGDRHR